MATAAGNTRIPAMADFSFWLGSQNPYKDQITGLYPNYSDVSRGTNWRNQQILNNRQRLAGARPASASTLGSNSISGDGRYGVQRLTKNQPIENMIRDAIGQAGKNSTANQRDYDSYFKINSGNLKASAANNAQEGRFIDEAFNGVLEGDLAGTRSRYSSAARSTNTGAASALADMRSRYGSATSSIIDKLAGDLGSQRAGYEARTAGEISAEEAARAGLRNTAYAAQKSAGDVGIDSAFRDWKAQQGGNVGSTYALRSLAQPRAALKAAIEVRNADMARDDYGITRGQRAGLTDKLSALERGEIAGTGEARLRLNDTLGNRERDDYSYTLGRDEALNRDMFNAERSDIGAVRDAAGRLIGTRRTLRNNLAADTIAPVGIRDSIMSSDLRNAAAISALDDANNFYSIRDRVADGYRAPSIPDFGRIRSSIDFNDLGGYQDILGMNRTVQPLSPAIRNARGGVGISKQTGAREAYRAAAGVYPEEDPLFDSNLWNWSQQQVQTRPSSGQGASVPEFLDPNYFRNNVRTYAPTYEGVDEPRQYFEGVA